MRTLKAILLCIGLTCTYASQSQTPCEWFDFDGDGISAQIPGCMFWVSTIPLVRWMWTVLDG